MNTDAILIVFDNTNMAALCIDESILAFTVAVRNMVE